MVPRRLTFSLPLYSIVPILTGFLMLWGGLTLFNAFRFLSCASWVVLPAPPQKVVGLQGMLHEKFYVQAEGEQAYCFQRDHWASCLLPPYEIQSELASTWVLGRLSADFQAASVMQALRIGSYSGGAYYVLLEDGQILTCSTSLRVELENMIRSGLIVWLLVPLVVLIWSILAFGNIFIRQAQPILWDWWGRGERIK